MVKITSKDVIEALKNTVDPEIGIDIVELGLVYSIRISEGNDIEIRLTMTSPMCPVTSIILADVQIRLEHLQGVGKVDVDLVWEPPWNPGMIAEEARLGLQ